MTINKRHFVDYTILTLFVASSGVPYLTTTPVYIVQFILLLAVFIYRKCSVDMMSILFFVTLLGITVFQTLVFNLFPLMTIIGLFTRIMAAYLIVKILADNFIGYYVKLLYVIAIISLLFYIPISVLPSSGTVLLQLVPLFHWLNPASQHETILLYNFAHTESFRNSGPFWEPGAFAGYLTLAFVFSYTIKQKLFSKQNSVLLLTLLSTQSTTAFVALFIFLLVTNYEYIHNIFIKIFAMIIIGVLGYYAFTSLDFLGEKIFQQMETAQTVGIQGSDDTQRFLNIMRDMEDLENHELLGRGVNPETRFSFGPKDQIRTVGLTDVMVKFGIPFFLLMLYMMYKSIDRFIYYQLQHKSRLYNIGIFITILITLMSEVYFNYPMYWSLLFLSVIYKYPRRTV